MRDEGAVEEEEKEEEEEEENEEEEEEEEEGIGVEGGRGERYNSSTEALIS